MTTYRKLPRTTANTQLQDVLDAAEQFAQSHRIPFLATFADMNGRLHTFKCIPDGCTEEIPSALRELGDFTEALA